MKYEKKLSVVDKLLLAANWLDVHGKTRFSAEDLVVSAWKEFPNTFGLSGHLDNDNHPMYPDSNRVFAEIMGSKPIRQKGFLIKVGEKMYALTEAGRAHVQTLIAQVREDVETQSHGKSGLPREIAERLRSILGSKAVQKVENGEMDRLSFHDACLFWSITPRSSAIELKGQLARVSSMINTARVVLQEGAAQFTHGGKVFSEKSLNLVEETHNELLQKFSEEIKTIEKRTDQRKT